MVLLSNSIHQLSYVTMYQVFDNCNKFVGTFKKYNDADQYRHLQGRPDWTIKQVPKKFFTSSSTERQRRAVDIVRNG